MVKLVNKIVIRAVMVVLCWGLIGVSAPVLAEEASPPASVPLLVIAEIDVTSSDGQFIVLYNNIDQPVDLSKVQIEYFNHYDPAQATSSKLITPTGTLASHSYAIINDEAPLLLCYQALVEGASLGFSSHAGFIKVSHFPNDSPALLPILDDYVRWSSEAVAGVPLMPPSSDDGGMVFLSRQPVSDANNPVVDEAGTGQWATSTITPADPCTMQEVLPIDSESGSDDDTAPPESSPVVNPGNQLLAATPPPATIVTAASQPAPADQSAVPHLPAADTGLMAPQLTELLPNPALPSSDDTDEFIELYNANPVPFDLTGFSLQVGTTSPRSYTFASGISLPPNGFRSFTSKYTHLTLTNSGGEVILLDPFGNDISHTAAYGNAKEGQSWALAKGKWYWSLTSTPGKVNTVTLPANKASSTKNTTKKPTKDQVSTNSQTAVKGTSTTADPALPTTTTKALATSQDADTELPLHPAVLAGVGVITLLYAGYEYRHDMANRIYQFRKYRAARRKNRPGD